MVSDSTAWFARAPESERADVRLIAIPPAGSSAAFFNEWRPHLPGWLELVGLRLPGRESRFLEPSYDEMDELVTAIEAAIADEITSPYAVLGHCGGAFTAFELFRLVNAQRDNPPVKLFVVGQPPPHILKTSPVSPDLPLADLIEWLKKAGGTPAVVISNPDLIELLEPSIRSDLRVLSSYSYDTVGPPLTASVSAIGAEGDPDLRSETLAAWGDLTTGNFRLHLFDSRDHLLFDRISDICAVIADELGQFR
jgi:medium-chain acyl-[acyl-carrier-protein] hydrolase